MAGEVGWALIPIVGTAAILAILPSVWFGDSPYTTSLAVQALVFASWGVGFNLIFGCTNQLFLCVGALAGIGGYGTAILSDRTSLPMAAGIAVGTASAAIVGGLLSWIAVRRSLGVIFTGVVTLVFSLAFANLLLGQRDLTGAETGLIVTGLPDGLADDRVGAYYLFAGVLVAFLVVFRALQLSHVGWAFRALRDDEVAAELAGVDIARYRIYAATVGSAMIGLTGAFYAYSSGFISPATYAFDRVDVRVLVLVAFGGLGTLLGPVVGAARLRVPGREADGQLELREVLYGVFLIAIFLGFPTGGRPRFRRPVQPTLRPPARAARAGADARVGSGHDPAAGMGVDADRPVSQTPGVDNTALLERLAHGKLVEGPEYASEDYVKGLARTLIVSGDTELISAPAYLKAAERTHPGCSPSSRSSGSSRTSSVTPTSPTGCCATSASTPTRSSTSASPRSSVTRTPSTSRSRPGPRWWSPTASTTAPASSCSATSSSTRRTARGSAPSSRSTARRRSTSATASAG